MNSRPLFVLLVTLIVCSAEAGSIQAGEDSVGRPNTGELVYSRPTLNLRYSFPLSYGDLTDSNSFSTYDPTTTQITTTLAYTITDLGGVYPTSINDMGQVVGSWNDHPYLWQNGILTGLGTLGGPRAGAWDINDLGQIAGTSEYPLPPDPGYPQLYGWHAFLWQNGAMIDLGPPCVYDPEYQQWSCQDSFAYAINDSGQVAGFVLYPTYTYPSAALWQNGAIHLLDDDPSPPGTAGYWEATEINESGQVVGIARCCAEEPGAYYGCYPFIWQHAQGTAFGGIESMPTDINDLGQVVGVDAARDDVFLWESGVTYYLDIFESADVGINNLTQVVGGGGENGYAFLWQDGITYDLNDLIAPYSGWELEIATDINDSGQIVGYGSVNGEYHGFLLTPLSHLEVTQAIQDENNSVPLIENKPTVVRAYVDCGPSCTSQPGVTGVLHGYGPSGELPGSPLQSINGSITAYHVDWRSQRGDLNKTLNFILPKEWRTGMVTLEADINMAGRTVKSTHAVTFQAARVPDIVYVPVRYEAMEPTTRIALGSQWAQRVWPTSSIDYTKWPTMVWSPDAQCQKTAGCPKKDLKFQLTKRYFLGQTGDYIFGWLPDGAPPFIPLGSSDPSWYKGGGGKAAFGQDDPVDGQKIFAHEIAHLLGRHHTKNDPRACADLDSSSDWPYATATIQEWGLDIDSFGLRLKDKNSVDDYMSYCWIKSWGGRPAWTSPWTYNHIYSEALKPPVADLADQSLSTSQLYFIVAGLIYTDDTATVDPVWVITSTMTPGNQITGTEFCLEAQNASGTPLSSYCFDLSFLDYDTGEATDVDGFSWMLPYPDGLARIVLNKGPVELAVRSVTAHVPEITVLSPNGGESWSATGTYTITWTANDDDGDQLTYQVLYSTDGATWIPAAGPITQTQTTINAAELAGSSTARIRVMASDGVNTTMDESDGAFTVGRKPPSVDIVSPENGISVVPGTPLWLQGYAYDLEDGVLGDSMLQWSSDRDGLLGTGSELLVTLSQGWHVITLAAQDSDGNEVTAAINVYVGYRIYLPLALTNR